LSRRSEPIVTRLPGTARDGGPAALGESFSVVYGALRERVHARRRRAFDADAHDAAALIHEACHDLGALVEPRAEHRAAVLAVAAHAMRRLVIDDARRQRDAAPQRHAGAASPARLRSASEGFSSADRLELLLDLDASLDRLQRDNPRHGRIVECLFFGGLTTDDTAAALGIEPAAVRRGWMIARAWLYRDLQGPRTEAEA
jgi:RNA polymerase sigma factor (TIGR02999 family)